MFVVAGGAGDDDDVVGVVLILVFVGMLVMHFVLVLDRLMLAFAPSQNSQKKRFYFQNLKRSY